ncbi:hypothetical protein CPR19088_GLDEOEPO_01363 [Companilactobacillus paralimentarius]
MSMYSIKKMQNEHWQILVTAVDDINDGLIFIVDPAWTKITDVGYMFNNLRILEHEISRFKRVKICEEFSSFYDCKFDESSEEIYIDLDSEINLDEVVMSMVQACTAISTVINYERYWK